MNAENIANRVECENFGEASKQPRVSVSAFYGVKPQDLSSGSVAAGNQRSRRSVDAEDKIEMACDAVKRWHMGVMGGHLLPS
jgi:hypothetical protein